MRLRFKIVLAAVLGVVVIWSVAWFAVATFVERKMDTAIAGMRADGLRVSCADRSIAGYPFRLEVRCGHGSQLWTDGRTVRLGGLTAVALIYRPDRLIVEARAPAEIAGRGAPPLRFDWTLAHMSAAFDAADRARIGLSRLSLEATGLVASAGTAGAIGAGRVRFHARENPERAGALDLALEVDQFAPYPGADPIDFSALAVVGDGGHVLAGRADALLAALASGGVPVEITELTVASGEAKVSAAGTVRVRADGLVDGEIDVAIAGMADGELPYMNVMLPAEQAKPLAEFLQTALSYGRETTVAGTPGRAFTLTIESGRVRAGLVPLGQIPRIALGTP